MNKQTDVELPSQLFSVGFSIMEANLK